MITSTAMIPVQQQQVVYPGGVQPQMVAAGGMQPIQGGTVVTSPPPPDTFPYKKHRVTGFMQIGLGLIAILLQIINLTLVNQYRADFITYLSARGPSTSSWSWSFFSVYVDGVTYDVSLEEHQYYNSFGAAYACTGIWTGLLFILAGAFGAAITEERKSNRICLRNTYITLSVLVAILVASTLFISASAEVGMASWYQSGVSEGRAICPGLLILVGISEFILAIVAASIGCCCSRVPPPVASSQVVTMVTYGQQPAYPTGQQPAYPTGQQQAYPTGQQPAYPPPAPVAGQYGPPQPGYHYPQQGQPAPHPGYPHHQQGHPPPQAAPQVGGQYPPYSYNPGYQATPQHDPPPAYQALSHTQSPSAPPDPNYGLPKKE